MSRLTVLHRSSIAQILIELRNANPFTGLDWSEVARAHRVFISDPGQGILHIIAAGRNSHWQKWVKERLSNQASALHGATIAINIPKLLQLPETTLGGAYARHITNQGFDPEAFATSNDRTDWIMHRMALSHDVHHVITGFDGSPVGEFGLAAFVLVQYRDLLNVFVLSFVPWTMLGYPRQAFRMVAAIVKGFRMGTKCQPIIAYPFEANWQKSLLEVRRELGINGFA